MKRIGKLLLALLLTLTGCNRLSAIYAPADGNCYPNYAVRIGGQLYSLALQETTLTQIEALGRITSYLLTDYPPTVGHQSTVPEYVGGEYGAHNGRLYLYYFCLWHPC